MEHYEKVPWLIQLTFKYSEAAVFSNFHICFMTKKRASFIYTCVTNRTTTRFNKQTRHFLQKYTSNRNFYVDGVAKTIFKWRAICTSLIIVRCNYHHIILPLQNSGVSKKSSGTSKLSVREELLNEAILSLCNTTTREIARRDVFAERYDDDAFDCCSLTPQLLPSAGSPSTFIKESSSMSTALIILRRRYSWRNLGNRCKE